MLGPGGVLITEMFSCMKWITFHLMCSKMSMNTIILRVWISEDWISDFLLYIHTYIHTYIHMYIHIHIHTYIHTYVHTYVHTYTHTYTHTYIHTYVYIHIHTYMCFVCYVHTYFTCSILQECINDVIMRSWVWLMWSPQKWNMTTIHL